MIKNNKLSVLIEVTAFIPNKTYGGQTVLDGFVKSLNKSNIINPTYIINSKSSAYMDKIVKKGDIVSLKLPNNNFIKNLVLKKKIYNEIKISNFDWIYFYYNIGFKTKIPSIVFVHDLASRFYLKNFIFKGIVRNIIQYQLVKKSIFQCNYVICSTKKMRNEISNLKLKEQKYIKQIYFGNNKDNNFLDKKNELNNFQNYLFFPSYKEPHKNINIVINGFHYLLSKNPDNKDLNNIKFIFSGKKDTATKLLKKKFIKKGITNKIIFTGYISSEEMFNYYKNARLIIFPTLYEGFGLPVIESQIARNNLLMSNLNVLQEISNNEGIFFNNNDLYDFAAKLWYALNSSNNKINYQNKLLNRTWNDVIDDYEDFFTSISEKN